MATVAELLARGESLASEDGRRDAEILLCAALQKSRSYLFAWPDAEVSSQVEARFQGWLKRRDEGTPIAYLTGEREFWSLPLAVSEATLIPRPDTETLIEAALELPVDDDARVLDLGTGSGAIALALASERPAWRISATDRSVHALAVARDNGTRLQLTAIEWRCGDWYTPVSGESFDLIVSNPPYLASHDVHLLAGDLRFEPRDALVAANDGMAAFEAIIAGAPEHLAAGGWLVLEHGFEQAVAVRGLLVDQGFTAVRSCADLSGHERVSLGQWRPFSGAEAGHAL